MSSSPHSSSHQSGLNLLLFTIPQSFLIQVGTVSVLALSLAEQATVEAITAIGTASEEIFRGDRLPLLDFPNTDESVTN